MSRFGPLILLLCSAARAEDARLDALRSSLTSMRGVPADIAVGPRGATPQLTVAKHALRDWMEAAWRHCHDNRPVDHGRTPAVTPLSSALGARKRFSRSLRSCYRRGRSAHDKAN